MVIFVRGAIIQLTTVSFLYSLPFYLLSNDKISAVIPSSTFSALPLTTVRMEPQWHQWQILSTVPQVPAAIFSFCSDWVISMVLLFSSWILSSAPSILLVSILQCPLGSSLYFLLICWGFSFFSCIQYVHNCSVRWCCFKIFSREYWHLYRLGVGWYW